MKNYLEKLEYPKILNILSNYASTYLGKEKCLNLIPSNNIDTVKSTLSETEEALNILYRCNTPPISEIADNTKNLKAIESYSTLSIKSILELTNILKISGILAIIPIAKHPKNTTTFSNILLIYFLPPTSL